MKKFFGIALQTRIFWVVGSVVIAWLMSWFILEMNPLARAFDHLKEMVEFLSDKNDSWTILFVAIVLSAFLNGSVTWSVLAFFPLLLFVESGAILQIDKQLPGWLGAWFMSIVTFVGTGYIYREARNIRKPIIYSFIAICVVSSFLYGLRLYGFADTLKNFATGSSSRVVNFIDETIEQIFDDGVLMWCVIFLSMLYVLYRKLKLEDRKIWATCFCIFAFAYSIYPMFSVIAPTALQHRESDVMALAKNIYHEVGSAKIRPLEPEEALYAVAEVTLGRKSDNARHFGGGTVRGVVYARKQFSWTLYRAARHAKMWESENPTILRRWRLSLQVAENSLKGEIPPRYMPMINELRRECVRYYKRSDNAGTSARGRSTFDALTKVRKIGAHDFYKDTRVACRTR